MANKTLAESVAIADSANEIMSIVNAAFLTPTGNVFTVDGSQAWGLPLLLLGSPGASKCLGRGTPVLMADGQIKKVEDVQVGDFLMGPDSKPRRVLETCSGTDQLFLIRPKKGEPWVCNAPHILTLVHSVTDEIIDIPLNEYLSLEPWRREKLKLFHQAVDFPLQEKLPIDPYFLAVWFGDGTKTLRSNGGLAGVQISKPDKEIEDLCRETAAKYGLEVSVSQGSQNTCPTWKIVGKIGPGGNPFLDLLRTVVGPDANIPRQYLTASREDRQAFLAGFIDTDGSVANKCVRITQKRKDYIEALAFIARSLGFRALESSFEIKDYGTYYALSLSGDFSTLPIRIKRKQCTARKQKKNALRTQFQAESIGEGEYFGFELDGDGRFLLGDFTVTHNTTRFYQYAKTWGIPFESLKPASRGEGFFGCTPAVGEDEGGKKVLDFPLPRSFVNKFSQGAGLVLLDELTNARPAIKPALLGFLQERELGELKFGPRVRIFAAANPVDEAAAGYELSMPEANRIGHLRFPDPTVQDWVNYMASSGRTDVTRRSLEAEEARVLKAWDEIWPRSVGLVAGFLNRRSDLFRKQPSPGDPAASGAWSSPRTWEMGTRALTSAEIQGLSANATESFLAAFVGNTTATEFMSWRVNQDLPDPALFLDGKITFKHSVERLDRTYALLTSCVALLSQETLERREARAKKFWTFVHTLVDTAADIAFSVYEPMMKSKLTIFPEAHEVIKAGKRVNDLRYGRAK